jgi:hypothetical protein
MLYSKETTDQRLLNILARGIFLAQKRNKAPERNISNDTQKRTIQIIQGVVTQTTDTNVSAFLISFYVFIYSVLGEPGSSVSILSGYGLEDRAIKVRSPAEAEGFFL